MNTPSTYPFLKKNISTVVGMVIHAFHPNTQGAEVSLSLQVWNLP